MALRDRHSLSETEVARLMKKYEDEEKRKEEKKKNLKQQIIELSAELQQIQLSGKKKRRAKKLKRELEVLEHNLSAMYGSSVHRLKECPPEPDMYDKIADRVVQRLSNSNFYPQQATSQVIHQVIHQVVPQQQYNDNASAYDYTLLTNDDTYDNEYDDYGYYDDSIDLDGYDDYDDTDY